MKKFLIQTLGVFGAVMAYMQMDSWLSMLGFGFLGFMSILITQIIAEKVGN